MLKFGGTSYPLALPDADTRSLARICDPFASIYLEFCQTVINHYCQAAWIATGVGGDSKKTDREWKGRNSQNKVIVFPKSADTTLNKGSYVQVRVTECTQATLRGVLVS